MNYEKLIAEIDEVCGEYYRYLGADDQIDMSAPMAVLLQQAKAALVDDGWQLASEAKNTIVYCIVRNKSKKLLGFGTFLLHGSEPKWVTERDFTDEPYEYFLLPEGSYQKPLPPPQVK